VRSSWTGGTGGGGGQEGTETSAGRKRRRPGGVDDLKEKKFTGVKTLVRRGSQPWGKIERRQLMLQGSEGKKQDILEEERKVWRKGEGVLPAANERTAALSLGKCVRVSGCGVWGGR